MTEDPIQQAIRENPLDTIVALCQALARLEDEVAAMEEQMKEKQQRIKDLSTRQIPDLMSSIRLTELRLMDGRKIAIKPDILASVSKERMPQVLAWLRAHNAQAIAKEKLSVQPRNDDDLAHAQRVLVANGLDFVIDASIHPSTLRSFVKEQLEQGTPDFPRELFGVHEGSKAVITTGR